MDLVYMQQTQGGSVIWCEQQSRSGHQCDHDKIRIRTYLSPAAFLLHFLERCVFRKKTLTLHETTANEQQSIPNWQENGSGDESTDMFTY